MWLTCNFFLKYPYIIQQTENKNTQYRNQQGNV